MSEWGDDRDYRYSSRPQTPPLYTHSRPLSRAARSARASLVPGYQTDTQESNKLDSVNNRIARSKEILVSLKHLAPVEKNGEKDLRDLKSPNFQKEATRNILEFKDSQALLPDVTRDSFRMKETATFRKLFTTLYSLYDPAHVYKGNLKDEFGDLLLKLGGSVPKNITEVAGTLGNWEKALGLLDWMVKLLKAAESLKAKESNELPVKFEDEITSFYCMRRLEEFGQFASGEPEQRFQDELQQIFVDRTGFEAQSIADSEKMVEELKAELAGLERQEHEYREVDAGISRYREKKEALVQSVERNRKKVAERKLKMAATEKLARTTVCERDAALARKREIQAEIQRQPYPREAIEKMRQEEEQLVNAIRQASEQLQTAQDCEKASLIKAKHAETQFLAAKSGFKAKIDELDLSSFCDVDLAEPGQGQAIIPEERWEGIKAVIFKTKEKVSAEKRKLSQEVGRLQSEISTIQERIEALTGQNNEAQQEICQLEANYAKLKEENSKTNEILTNNLTEVNASIVEARARHTAEIDQLLRQVKTLESNQIRIQQLSTDRIQAAIGDLKRIVGFAKHLKQETTKCIAEAKSQVHEVTSLIQDRLESLNAV